MIEFEEDGYVFLDKDNEGGRGRGGVWTEAVFLFHSLVIPVKTTLKKAVTKASVLSVCFWKAMT